MLTLLLAPAAAGWSMIWSDARPWTPQVNAGHAYRIVDSTGAQVGAIVAPQAGRVDVMGVVQTDVSSGTDGTDIGRWRRLYAEGSAWCDFNGDGQVNADDQTEYRLRLEGLRPDYNWRLDVNQDGFVNADDADTWTSWFVWGDPRADFDSNGFVNGDDADAFTEAFEQGR